MRTLSLWATYTRQEAHDIFDPDSTFRPQVGTWGLQGIVPVPDSEGDFVFFVTFGASQGAHDFEEEITEDGVLTWQSQPRQRLHTPVIKRLISHNDLTNTVHLFLRTRRRIPYTYFGELGYLDHDPTREAPVHFTWQLMSWPAPHSVLEDLHLAPTTTTEEPPRSHAPQKGQLTKTDPPTVRSPGRGPAPGTIGSAKQAVLPRRDAKNRELGLAGEKLVLRAEDRYLKDAGREDLASKLVHVSIVEGDAAGYDIRSYSIDGTTRHIEVKTTQGPAANAFFISPNELRFSKENPDTFVIVRVYGYSYETDSAHYYEASGPITETFRLTASEYRAQLLPTQENA
jgi:hypothetical protein